MIVPYAAVRELHEKDNESNIATPSVSRLSPRTVPSWLTVQF